MKEQVLCDVEWSPDIHVVWLESRAATELTLHIQARVSLIQDFVFKQHDVALMRPMA